MPSNVLSKHPIGPDRVQEPIHFRPEVAVIFLAALLSDDTKWLTWIPACPNRSIVGPSGEPQSKPKSSDPGEEMDLSVSFEVIRLDFLYVTIINVARR